MYGLLIACAIALSVFLCTKEEKRLSLPEDFSVDLALRAVPAAVVGARLYYVAFQWPLYASDPVRILWIWEGGVAIYGAIIGGVVAGWFFARKRKVPFGTLADLVAPVLILSQAIGRWGNFFNGEAYGYPVENPALQFFPMAVRIGEVWHYATFFYESAWDFCGFLLLWRLRKKPWPMGSLGLLYLTWYGAGRTVIEAMRSDSLMLGPFRVSQLLSVLLAVSAGVTLMIRFRKSQKKTVS